MSALQAARHSIALLTLTAVLFVSASPTIARKPNARNPVPSLGPGPAISLDQQLSNRPLRSTAAPDTTWLGYWTFDFNGACTDEGWTRVDRTAQDLYFHVDDFAGLGGGNSGVLIPIEGNQSMWCGARPNPTDDELCGYATLPGYGNNWYQTFSTVNCLGVNGDVVVDFLMTWDTEPGYDGTQVQYDLCDDNWLTVDLSPSYYGFIDGWGNRELISAPVADADHSGSLRVRLLMLSDGAWSDEDGIWDTDGALIVDSLTVTDASGQVLPTEYFETESVGDMTTTSGSWEAGTIPGFGDYSGLYPGVQVLQEDPCYENLTCLWGFFNGSAATYSCGGYPEIPAVPYGPAPASGFYIWNEIWSPWVPILGAGNTFEIGFDVYRDIPLDNLVFYVWHVKGSTDGVCGPRWRDTGTFFHGLEDPDWYQYSAQVDHFLDPGDAYIRMAIGVVDQCPLWCGSIGAGSCHSHAPLFDNAWIRRIDTNGPRWIVQDIDLFQDNFASDGTTTGTVRADAAIDVAVYGATTVDPGDSCSVTVGDLDHGLAIDSHTGFGAAAYVYVGVWPQGQPGKDGDALTSDPFRWPVVDSLTYGGDKWYCVRLDTAFATTGRDNPVDGKFCVDLNDNLFTPGDTVCYFFAATNAGPGNESTYYSRFTGTTDDLAEAASNPMEFTCLPVPRAAGGRHILYVDNFDGLGAQPFFDTAFEMMGIAEDVDRYDVLEPMSSQDNGLAGRVVEPLGQLVSQYHTIIWNSGDLESGTLRDRPNSGELSADDTGLLKFFLDNLPVLGGLYLSGDNLANDWLDLDHGSATQLRNTYMEFTVPQASHVDYGLGRSPLVLGVTDGCFYHEPEGPDTLVAFGGCPDVTEFNVLAAAGNSTVEAEYVKGGTVGGAILKQTTTNPLAVDVGVVLSGFSYHSIRDAEPHGLPARAEHLRDVLLCLGILTPEPTSAGGPSYRNSLAQNYPNPFNPTTTVEFTLKERSRVTIRVYNVAGQLVTTLVDDVRAPGVLHKATWNGVNRSGEQVASGVYFYKLTTKGYTKTRKMVLLK